MVGFLVVASFYVAYRIRPPLEEAFIMDWFGHLPLHVRSVTLA